MEIVISDKIRIGVTPEYFALKHPEITKGVVSWREIKWFSSLERCILYVVQEELSLKEEEVDLGGFLTAFRGLTEEVLSKIKTGNIKR